MSTLNIAVIGAGLLGTRHARVFAEQPNARLVAVADVNLERARAVAHTHGATAYATLADALAHEHFDAVAIATPDHLHREPVFEALAAGKHVFLEKPVATELADVKAIVDATAAAHRVVAVNFSQRFLTDYAWIKRAIDAGDIGRPRMVTSIKFDTVYVPTGMLAWAAQTSPFYFMSSHDLDLICWYLGRRPVQVYATETRGVLDAKGVRTHDGMNVLVQFEDGIITNFHSSWIHPNTYPAVADGSMQIIGSDGVVHYNNRLRRIEFHNARSVQAIDFTGPATATEMGGKLEGAFTESVRAFLRSVETGAEPETSPRRVIAGALIQDAAKRSLASGLPAPIETHEWAS